MAKYTHPKETLSSVKLSTFHEAALIREAETIVRETIHANEAFLQVGSRFLPSDWRFVRSRQGLDVYCQRSDSKSNIYPRKSEMVSPRSTASFFGRTSCVASGHSVFVTDTLPSRQKSPMVLHGTLDGSLNDCMFGSLATTEEAWRWRSSHIFEKIHDGRLLATIKGPSLEDPFRFLGLKWYTNDVPLVLSGILQRRDYLIIEATGLTRDAHGDVVGYFLSHSVTLPGVAPDLSHLGVVRDEVSTCYIFRQRDANLVELYCRSSVPSRNRNLGRLTEGLTADALLSAIGIIDYAYIRKLTWLVKNKQMRIPARRCQTRQHRGLFPRCTRCEVCDKSLSYFVRNVGAQCHICRKVVCKNCRLVKKMTVDVSRKRSSKLWGMQTCVCCLLEAKEICVKEMMLDSIEESRSVAATLISIELCDYEL
ncbi:hypothetical protein CCR75_009420 [Bremia lactucae]|uniref:FYVE-type domain-containing protein n=1 Tax=Bremia lactucae TaxID=4779 RepID=A0A976FGV6_BRELC|nr:hypothetical protein CCR75_009420 [Bremia lactucae]